MSCAGDRKDAGTQRQKLMRSKQFLLGCIAGFGLAVALNLVPYMWTTSRPVADDYEVAGFPLTFHRAGGVAYTEQLFLGALLLDLVFALLLTLLVGLAATKLFPSDTRGFPVGSMSNGPRESAS